MTSFRCWGALLLFPAMVRDRRGAALTSRPGNNRVTGPPRLIGHNGCVVAYERRPHPLLL